ncbi:30S ribosome-binding factor RbfA [Pseudomonadota bacterium]
MAREFSRSKRVAAQIQRELAELIQFEVKDPRVGLITVSAVDVTRDLAYAKVFITMFDTEHSVEEAVEALNHAAGYLRRELGRRMKLRITPELTFLYDASVERGANLSALINSAVDSDKKNH